MGVPGASSVTGVGDRATQPTRSMSRQNPGQHRIASPRSAAGSPVVPRAHRRQFVVGPEPFRAHEDWNCVALSSGVWLSHCPELRTGFAVDAEGTHWALLGLAVESDPDAPMPLDHVAKSRTSEVPSILPGWAGRWALVGAGAVHPDASALLSCFHTESDGLRWASSSPALIARLAGQDLAEDADPRPLHYERGIGWVPPPRSRFARVARLLPSQRLDLRSGVAPRWPLTDPMEGRLSHDDRLERVERRLRTVLARLPEFGEPIWLGLSAGHDSRTMLALCRAAGVDVRLFTRIAPRMSVADHVLPPRLAERCGLAHTGIEGASPAAERLALAAEHSAGHVSAGDALPYLRGERAGLRGISIGGQAFELFSGDYERLEPIDAIGDPEDTARRIATAFGEPEGSTATAALADWLRWVVAHPADDFDWRDRFYLEQETAGWMAAKEQLYDLDDVMRFPVANAGHLWSLLLGFEENELLGKAIQEELIARAAPELLEFPFNPPDRDFGLRGLVAAKSWGLPSYGFRRAARALRRQGRGLFRSPFA